MTELQGPAGRVGMRPRAPRVGLLLAIVALAWGSALFVLQLHVFRGPAQQSVSIRWAPQTTDLERRTAERALRLREGEESEPGKWTYRLQDQSREEIRRIVNHPLITDTSHIDREAFRILIDAPEVPALLRRVLEADLGAATALALALLGCVAFWPVRKDVRRFVDVIRSVRGLETGAAVAILVVGFAFFYDNGHGVDENIHYDQIARLARGDWSLHPSLTMLPGFHSLVAGLVWATGGISELSVRLVVLLLSVATVLVFHALASTLQPAAAGMRTLQFTLLPILFPQFFLVYTDVASLLFVLWMMLAAVRRQYWLAGALGIVSCLMRQNDVLWVAFVLLWSYLRESGWVWRPLRESLGRYWTFMAAGLGFLVFVAANEGQVALGEDVGSHPLGSLHFANFFFMLFLSGLLFLPLWWGYRTHVLAAMRRSRPWVSLLVAALIFWLGFVIDHPHNLDRADYFLPNAVLIYFSSSPFLKALFFVPVAVAWLSFAAVPMKTPWWLLFPFAFVFLLPEWLVVPRYYLIPLSFFLLAREPATPGGERLQTACFAVTSAALFVIMERGWGWV